MSPDIRLRGVGMRRVIVESPYSPSNGSSVEANLTYLRACLRDCLDRGEAPYASHGLYTQPGVLDDNDPTQRNAGMAAGWEWMRAADAVVVYTDRGVSVGMERGIAFAESLGLPVEYRSLPGGGPR